MLYERKSGVLLHPTSLPSAMGIGDFGENAYRFVETLADAGQTLWQLLPLCPIDYSGSPYQSTSAFAGEPLLISPSLLIQDGLLEEADVPQGEILPTDYEKARSIKLPLLDKAYRRFLENTPPEEYHTFLDENAFWLPDYALFTAVKAYLIVERKTNPAGLAEFIAETTGILSEDAAVAYFNNACWCSFPKPLRRRNLQSIKKWSSLLQPAIDKECFLQYLFHKQWRSLKQFANQKGIEIIGDLPIFIAHDSADVWANQNGFLLNSLGFPTVVAGVPPDYFSETGQLWGNPLYDWRYQKKTGYLWWLERVKKALCDADYLRIDHFRGFAAYWEIPWGAPDARMGRWAKGPGITLFETLEQALGSLPFIAEDLGIITPEVQQLRDQTGFPGMRILQFAFGKEENHPYLPHSYEENTVVYTGTHDNNTSLGWYQNATPQEQDHFRRYLNVSGDSPAWDCIRLAFSSPARMAIIPWQDVLSLPEQYRMNTPGTVQQNWRFSFLWDMLNDGQVKGLQYLSRLFGRNLPKN